MRKPVTMQRRHFVLIAQTIAALRLDAADRQEVAESFASALRSTNPGFDRERFMVASNTASYASPEAKALKWEDRTMLDESKIQKMNRWDVEAELAKCPEGALKRALWQQVWRLTEQGKWSGANNPDLKEDRAPASGRAVRNAGHL